MRVGLGYDIHRIDAARSLVLGGVEIEGEMGLAGHCDADVILHALMAALLGAAGLSDIGTQFPTSDERFRDVSSLVLLSEVVDMLDSAGFHVMNADVVLVAERPKIAPFVEEMQERISRVLGVEVAAIGIKATTNEGVGPEGRGEALSAQAVVLLEVR
jgi:2-C-methyl-D-erythritol 2,4-cyclodiphosphate synthase